jgi:hypothetical protein
MSNRASSFPAAPQLPPMHRYGGVLASTPELAMHAMGDAYWVEGTGTVRGLPGWPKGPPIHLYLVGSPTFVNSSKLLMPGSQNYTFSPGDSCWALPLGDGVWRVIQISRADGIPFVPGGMLLFPVPQTRLTLTQGTPETSADVTAATGLYLEPCDGDRVTVFDGVSWQTLTVAPSTYSLLATNAMTGTRSSTSNAVISGLSDTSQLTVGMQISGTGVGASSVISTIDSPTQVTGTVNNTGTGTATVTFKLPPNTNYDAYLSGVTGLPKLTWSAAWSNDTTPPTRAFLNGVEVASGASTKRLIGSARTTSVAGQLEDSHTHGYLSNRFAPRPRFMYATDPAANWTYSTASYRQANANTANQFDYICCVPRSIWAHAQSLVVNNTGVNNVNVGIGIDSTSGNSAQLNQIANLSGTTYVPTNSTYTGTPGIGRHYISWLEFGGGSNTQTWLATAANNVAGIVGEIAN